jgi:acyl dehydratase
VPIDPAVAVGAALPSRDFTWGTSDVLLYHLAIGASGDALRYVYEQDLQVLPTFAMVIPSLRDTAPPDLKMPGIDIDLYQTLHGRQELVIHKPLPTSGAITTTSKIVDVYDKGSSAVIVTSNECEYFTSRISMFVRGEGGFGGSRGPSTAVPVPDRAPDEEILTPTFESQAALYRLLGDLNPLHIDPEFAAMAGFPKPILHGLCTYGLVCMAVVNRCLDGDVSRLLSYSTRFAGVVYPGETLRTRVWQTPEGLVLNTSVVERDDAPALDNTLITHS